MEPAVHTTQLPPTEDEKEDTTFIVAIVLFSIGGVLLLIAIIRLAFWFKSHRKESRYKKWWLRQLDIKRHLSEYSIRTTDNLTNAIGGKGQANKAFDDEEGSIRSSPSGKSSPRPESSTSADVHNSSEETNDTGREDMVDDNMNDVKHIVT